MTRPFHIEDLERIGAAAQELLAVLGVLIAVGPVLPHQIAKIVPCLQYGFERRMSVASWIVGSIAEHPRPGEYGLADFAEHVSSCALTFPVRAQTRSGSSGPPFNQSEEHQSKANKQKQI